MSKKQKKKRNKKYRPEGVNPEVPVVHKFVAEEEEKKSGNKKIKRWLIFICVALLPLVLLGLIIF